jgi:hypothetical protein
MKFKFVIINFKIYSSWQTEVNPATGAGKKNLVETGSAQEKATISALMPEKIIMKAMAAAVPVIGSTMTI